MSFYRNSLKKRRPDHTSPYKTTQSLSISIDHPQNIVTEEMAFDIKEPFTTSKSHDIVHPSTMRASPQQTLPPSNTPHTFTHGKYDDLGLIGMGGMGEVRRVKDHTLDRIVAMKIIHRHLMISPQAHARFIEEAQICAQLQHPNIVPVYEVGELAQLFEVGNHFKAHLQLENGNDRSQVAVAGALSVAVDRALNVHSASANR